MYTKYEMWVAGTDLTQSGMGSYDSVLNRVVSFIKNLTPEQKPNFGLSWFELDDDGEESDLVVSVYDATEETDERTISNWPDAELEILRALV